MYYPPEIIEEVRSGNDIVELVSSYVPLRQRSGSYFGLCPFHNEKTPSFSVNPDRQMYHCFGCGESGNAIGFVMKLENCDFPDAVRFLADRIHYSLPEPGTSRAAVKTAELRERLYEVNRMAARFFYDAMAPEAAAYLDARGIGQKMRTRYGLGYADSKWDTLVQFLRQQGCDEELIRVSGLAVEKKGGGGYRDKFIGRLMFPIFSARGKVVGFGGRILADGEPKYLNSPDTPVFEKSKNLYGINFARATRSRHLIVVEGYMDVLALAQAGFQNVVAALGTAFNQEHVNLLRKHADTVTLLFDSDEAGTNAALRAIPFLIAGGLRTKVLQVRDAKDPDEYINKHGSAAFGKLLESAQSHVAFQLGSIRKRHDIRQTEGRVLFTQEAAKLLSGLESAVEREAYARDTAATTGISYDSIRSEITRLTAKDSGNGAVGAVRLQRRRDLPRESRAVLAAQKELLLLTAYDARVYQAVCSLLQPDELSEPVYARLLESIYAAHASGRDWQPAEAMNAFIEPDDQRMAAQVFAEERPSLDDRHLEISVTDVLRHIKNHNLDRRMTATVDDAELRELIEERKSIGNLVINLAE